ncbi:MAG: hypothetical protein COB98_10055 [Flavobacteriaceae bacterium]|nr:MAG: hypothetical protein COB98_10055 [Flavobacteriaceae bacterium]
MELALGLLLGALAMWYYKHIQPSSKANEKDALILIEKIKTVCKLITVEGDFAEIYHYQDSKEHFLNIFTSKKKAILLINAKAHIGFDLSKIKLKSNAKTHTIILSQFPEPTVLSIDSHVRYYDKTDGLFNKFAADDLTDLHREAKEFIAQKIPKSGLLNLAKKEALESILMIEGIVQTIGWQLDYSQLSLNDPQLRKLNNI